MNILARLLTASDTLSAAAVLGSVVFPRSRGLPVREIERRELQDLEADLYVLPGRPWPGVVLALGALREGRRYPILESTARAVASCGFAVLVPELGRLRRLVLGLDALDDLVHAARLLPGQAGVVDAPIGLIGFSLGGALALVAAGDPRLRGRVACVAAMGSYFRLSDILDAAVAGFTAPDGEAVALAGPSAYTVAASLVDLLPEPDRRRLEQLIDRNRDRAVEALSRVELASVGREAAFVLELLRNRDRNRRGPLIERVHDLAELMAALSPEGALARIGAHAWVLHDERDRYVPFGQFRSLRDAARGRANFTFLGIRLLEHTEPVPAALNPRALFGDYLPGLASLYRFARGPLAAVRRTARRAARRR